MWLTRVIKVLSYEYYSFLYIYRKNSWNIYALVERQKGKICIYCRIYHIMIFSFIVQERVTYGSYTIWKNKFSYGFENFICCNKLKWATTLRFGFTSYVSNFLWNNNCVLNYALRIRRTTTTQKGNRMTIENVAGAYGNVGNTFPGD